MVFLGELAGEPPLMSPEAREESRLKLVNGADHVKQVQPARAFLPEVLPMNGGCERMLAREP